MQSPVLWPLRAGGFLEEVASAGPGCGLPVLRMKVTSLVRRKPAPAGLSPPSHPAKSGSEWELGCTACTVGSWEPILSQSSRQWPPWEACEEAHPGRNGASRATDRWAGPTQGPWEQGAWQPCGQRGAWQ